MEMDEKRIMEQICKVLYEHKLSIKEALEVLDNSKDYLLDTCGVLHKNRYEY